MYYSEIALDFLDLELTPSSVQLCGCLGPVPAEPQRSTAWLSGQLLALRSLLLQCPSAAREEAALAARIWCSRTLPR